MLARLAEAAVFKASLAAASATLCDPAAMAQAVRTSGLQSMPTEVHKRVAQAVAKSAAAAAASPPVFSIGRAPASVMSGASKRSAREAKAANKAARINRLLADRREREAREKLEREEAAKALEPTTADSDDDEPPPASRRRLPP